MTSKADFKKELLALSPEERRKKLDEMDMTDCDDDEIWREHDTLAELVAEDEDVLHVAES